MFDSFNALSSAQQFQQSAETRLAKAAHDLAKAELSIEAPVEMMTARHESTVATTLAQAADEMYGQTLDLLG